MWVAAWHEFMDATGQPTALEPRRQVARYAPGCKIPDILSARPGGRPTCLDVTIAHQTPPRLASFGSLDAFLRGAERRKRAEYADWMQLRQQQPRVIPLVGTTLGVIGLAARRFFEASCRAFEGGNAVASDALAVQNLGTQRQSVFWRRRISTQLRIAVATSSSRDLGRRTRRWASRRRSPGARRAAGGRAPTTCRLSASVRVPSRRRARGMPPSAGASSGLCAERAAAGGPAVGCAGSVGPPVRGAAAAPSFPSWARVGGGGRPVRSGLPGVVEGVPAGDIFS